MINYEIYDTANAFYLVASQIIDQLHVKKPNKLTKDEVSALAEEFANSEDDSEEAFRAFQDKLSDEYEDHWELYIPLVVNTSFACELYLKFLLGYDGRGGIKGHDLLRLFEQLPEEPKVYLLSEKHSLVTKEYFYSNLNDIKTAFVDWRYWFEHTHKISANIVFLLQLAFELSAYCDSIILGQLDQTKASIIIQKKLKDSDGSAWVRSYSGKFYKIEEAVDNRSILCEDLPITPPYTYEVFDVIVDLLRSQGGRAKKGMGRNAKLGEPGCEDTTVVGAIGKYYAGKKDGDSIYDPVFVLAAVLEWAGIAHNQRGYLELTPTYQGLLNREKETF